MIHHSEPTTVLGEIIEQRRLELGLTKSEAARLAGVSRGTWHEVEAGRRHNMLADTLNLFDKALGYERGTLRRVSRPMDGRPDIVVASPEENLLTEAPVRTSPGQADDRLRLAELALSLPAEQVTRLVRLIEAEQKTGTNITHGPDLAVVTDKLDEILRRLEERTTAHDRPDEPPTRSRRTPRRE